MGRNPSLLDKTLIIGILVIFVCIGIQSAFAITNNNIQPDVPEITAPVMIHNPGPHESYSGFIFYNGSLSGYVNDTSGNPIEGALIRVYFHETYEEDYSESTGFYHVKNISICWCMKNSTCSKQGYKTEWVLLSINENTFYDFVLTEGNNAPDAPDIFGPTSGKPGIEYVYEFCSNDPENDNISYYIEWGDGTITGWTDYFPSGEFAVFSHTWDKIDWDNILRAKTKDIYGDESDWSTREIPIYKPNINHLLLRFIVRLLIKLR
ncbi:MAG: hypothetical protein AYK22_08555 [Thermoplasmatales archaeon SG8-52-3]|nr:MAG: hypothetical protein AYK22_08555 [Thermoplasmatales archaeon SG8-52-3]